MSVLTLNGVLENFKDKEIHYFMKYFMPQPAQSFVNHAGGAVRAKPFLDIHIYKYIKPGNGVQNKDKMKNPRP